MRNIEDFNGVRVGGQNINNLILSDETIMITDTCENGHIMLNILEWKSESKGVKINTTKTNAQ